MSFMRVWNESIEGADLTVFRKTIPQFGTSNLKCSVTLWRAVIGRWLRGDER